MLVAFIMASNNRTEENRNRNRKKMYVRTLPVKCFGSVVSSSFDSFSVRFFMLKFWVLLMYCEISSTRCDARSETRTAIIIATGAKIMTSHLISIKLHHKIKWCDVM